MYARISGHQNYSSRNPFDCTEIFAKLFDFKVKADLTANAEIDKTSMYQIIYNLIYISLCRSVNRLLHCIQYHFELHFRYFYFNNWANKRYKWA